MMMDVQQEDIIVIFTTVAIYRNTPYNWHYFH